MATIAAVVQELEFENIRIEDPPAAMYVASLQCVLVSGEFMIFTEPIIHLGVSHPCGLILGVGLSSRRLSMQLLRPSDMPCIRAPLDRTYLVYPPEVALTNLVVEVEVARILGAAFVFSVASIEGGVAGLSYGMSNAYTMRYRRHTSRNEYALTSFLSFPEINSTHSEMAWEISVRLARAVLLLLNRGSLNQNTSFSTILQCTKAEWELVKRRMAPANSPAYMRRGVVTLRVHRDRYVVKKLLKVELDFFQSTSECYLEWTYAVLYQLNGFHGRLDFVIRRQQALRVLPFSS
jgi:hypothetical protein